MRLLQLNEPTLSSLVSGLNIIYRIKKLKKKKRNYLLLLSNYKVFCEYDQLFPNKNESTSSFSLNLTLKPNWAALIAATYPPGPEPITVRSASTMIKADGCKTVNCLIMTKNSTFKKKNWYFKPARKYLVFFDVTENGRFLCFIFYLFIMGYGNTTELCIH